MMKQTRVFLHVLLLALCLVALFAAVGCEAEETAVPEAIITEPTPSKAPEPQTLDLSLALPEEAEQGDLLIAQICFSSSETAITPPSSDWVLILSSKNQTDFYTVTFYKMLTEEPEREKPYVFGLSCGANEAAKLNAAGEIMWFRGIDPNNPIYVNQEMSGNGSDLIAGQIDAKEPCLVVALFSMAGNGSGLTLPAERTELLARYSEATNGYVLFAAEGRYLSGASGEFSATATQGGAWISQVIALRLAEVDVAFEAGEHGTLTRERLDRVSVSARGSLAESDIPSVNADNGYAFTGWLLSSGAARLDAAGVCKLDLTDGMTLTAQYSRKIYTVKFDLGTHGASKDKLVFTDLHYGDTIKIPTVVTKIGWTFAGWDKTPATKVVGNATYTAKYTQNVYTVTFDLGEHGTSKDQLVWTGLHDLDTITIPDVRADEGWTFDGWDTTPETTVTGNATYTAQYSEAETGYTVTFELGEYGTSADTLVFSDLEDGDTITVPNVTPNEGWTFDGWDAEPETTVSGDATYHAVYSETGYTVTFVIPEGATTDDQLVFTHLHDGDEITVPEVRLPVGYIYLGWDPEPETTVYGDATYTLQYRTPPIK